MRELSKTDVEVVSGGVIAPFHIDPVQLQMSIDSWWFSNGMWVAPVWGPSFPGGIGIGGAVASGISVGGGGAAPEEDGES